MRADILASPKFDRLRRELETGSADLLLLLYRTAGWFERHAKYGRMSEPDASALDDHLRRPGFSERLRSCGWLKAAGGAVSLAGFCEPAATRKSLGARLRAAVLSAGRCAACGSTEELVVDHATPIARGGSSDPSNLQCLCSPCSRAKWRMTMPEFLAERRGA